MFKDFFDQVIFARFKPGAGVRNISTYSAGRVTTASDYNKSSKKAQRAHRIAMWLEMSVSGIYLLVVFGTFAIVPDEFLRVVIDMAWWLQVGFVALTLFVLYQFLVRLGFLRWAYKNARK